MAFTYELASGRLTDAAGTPLATGYSGHGNGVNNPAMQGIPDVGPIPCGSYTIGPPHSPIDHMGPLALALLPDAANEMHGRAGFFIHGDTASMNHTASNGCIIMPHDVRARINDGEDKQLVVVAGT